MPITFLSNWSLIVNERTKDILIIVGTIVYFIFPIDILPDVLPPLTYLDDAAVVGYVMKYFSDKKKRLAPPSVQVPMQPAKPPKSEPIDVEYKVVK